MGDFDSIQAVIRARSSWRSYEARAIDTDARSRLTSMLSDPPPGPFGSQVRLQLLDAVTVGATGGDQKLGTYGVIRGAQHFLGGVVTDGERALEDFGYVFQWAILQATRLGLATCWLGGTFRRGQFGQAVGAKDDDVVPAVSPVGYAASRRGVVDTVFRFVAGSKKRKPWSDLFFDARWGTPLAEGAAGPYGTALDMVRLGPSASNKQPWRIVRDTDPTTFHLYLRRSPKYQNKFTMDLQRVDMGIGMCHFELTARELELAGTWRTEPPDSLSTPDDTRYVVSWVGAESP